MSADTLAVPRAEFSVEDPWTVPRVCQPVRMRRATDGMTPRLATSLSAYYDDRYLTLVYSGSDDLIVATYLQHDDPLYEQDVVEAFLAPVTPKEYFEFEVSPRGTVFDARIESPDGVRSTMRGDRAWTCDGFFRAVRQVVESDGSMSVDTVMRVPFACMNRKTPAAGETWSANFFRIDRHPKKGDEYSAWQPTMKTPADFHVAAAFGTLRFE